MHPAHLNLDYSPEFDTIACYGDQHVKPTLGKLLQSPTFAAFIKDLTSNIPARGGQVLTVDHIAQEFAAMNSVDQMQQWIGHVLTPNLSKNHSSFNVHGLEKLDPSQKYLFISNHRDIIMDPLLLILLLHEKGYGTPHCAIGDNLLASPVSHDLALLNKCFKIIRAQQSPKAMLMTLKLQSSYIRYLHFVHRGNIWIAQREGRAKDNQDQTNPALIKMLGLACPKDFELLEYFNQLNLVPMCYSYEWDPCDIDKARELQANADGTSTGKTGMDDFNAVNKGLRGHKGQIDLHIGQPIKLNTINISVHQDIANLVDQFIWSHYHFYPVNYAAHELLHGQPHPACPFSSEQVATAKTQLQQRIQNETEDVKQRVLFAYSVNLKSAHA
jgi:hypothetical protein